MLDGYLKYPGFDGENADVKIKTQDRNGDTVPVEVEFTSADGNDAHYRFMLADVINPTTKSN